MSSELPAWSPSKTVRTANRRAESRPQRERVMIVRCGVEGGVVARAARPRRRRRRQTLPGRVPRGSNLSRISVLFVRVLVGVCVRSSEQKSTYNNFLPGKTESRCHETSIKLSGIHGYATF